MLVANNVASQLRRQRFPQAGRSSTTVDASFMDDDSDDDETQLQVEIEPHEPPLVSEWRSNLVALSQVENLYFVAYQDKIHVTIPRGLKQTISSTPDLIIDLPVSKEGVRVGGYLDRRHGHSVNHIKTGNMGALELLLIACDDGDILAYYTHNILAAIKTPKVKYNFRPFFHENVGISAWGLAIHSQSRMIAVGSNAREVVVYHFGCADSVPMTIDTPTCDANGDKSLETVSEQIKLSQGDPTLSPTAGDSRSEIRGLDFRKILKVGKEGHNIPCVDFSSDSYGEAHSILATDINGNLWILSIWQDGNPDEYVKRIPSLQKAHTRGPATMFLAALDEGLQKVLIADVFRGWGALALPLFAFKRTATPEEALGTAPCQLDSICTPRKVEPFKRHFVFDTTSTIPEVDIGDKSIFHPAYGYGIAGPNTTPAIPRLGVPVGLGRLVSDTATPDFDENAGNIPHRQFPNTSRKFFEALINSTRLEEYTPLDRETILSREGRLESLRPPRGVAVNGRKEQKIQNLVESEVGAKCLDPFSGPTYHLQDQCAILRTYQDDIELIPPCETMPVTMCRKVLRQELPAHISNQVNYERLIFHILIVDLGLVIVGSQVGRVALVSLTRPEDSFSQHGPATMFRVEHILPTYTHEVQGFRPSIPLLGIAASPMQGQQQERKRWRLIMQYYDHSILSYELYRDEGRLFVF